MAIPGGIFTVINNEYRKYLNDCIKQGLLLDYDPTQYYIMIDFENELTPNMQRFSIAINNLYELQGKLSNVLYPSSGLSKKTRKKYQKMLNEVMKNIVKLEENKEILFS